MPRYRSRWDYEFHNSPIAYENFVSVSTVSTSGGGGGSTVSTVSTSGSTVGSSTGGSTGSTVSTVGFLLQGETEGFSFDATIFGGCVNVKDLGTTANNLTDATFASANFTMNSTMGKYVRTASGGLTFLPAGTVPQSFDEVSNRYGILLENPATNLIDNSADLSAGSWSASGNVTVQTNLVAAPDGTLTADLLQETTGTGVHFIADLVSVSGGLTYTLSCYAKAAGRDWVWLSPGSGGFAGTPVVYFDLANGVVGTQSGATGAIEALANGWYRISLTATADASFDSLFGPGLATADNTNNYTGDSSRGAYFWGFQAETGTVPSSYIPTGSSSTINLIANSEDLTASSWSSSGGVFVSANSLEAPDGENTADKLVETSGGTVHFIADPITVTSGVSYIISCYAKAGERNWVWISHGAGGFPGTPVVYFDLTNGVVGTQTGASGTIELISDGWYRIAAVATADASASSLFGPGLANADAGNSYSGDGTSGAYFWGFQVEAVGTAGNLVLFSEDLSAASWSTLTGATISTNAVAAPTGPLTADKIAETAGGTFHLVADPITVTSGQTYTISCYAKAAERSWVWIALGAGGFAGTPTVFFDVTNGVKGTESGATGTITDAGNGWWRITATATADASASSLFGPGLASADGTSNYSGTLGNGAYFWGVQVEVGSSATTYIPTGLFPASAYIYTTTPSPTRVADDITVNLATIPFQQAPGTVYIDVSRRHYLPSSRPMVFSDGGVTLDDSVFFDLNPVSRGRAVEFEVYSLAVKQAILTTITPPLLTGTAIGTYNVNERIQATGSWNTNDIDGTVNGNAPVVDNAATMPVVTMTELQVGNDPSFVGGALHGHFFRFVYVPRHVEAEDGDLENWRYNF